MLHPDVPKHLRGTYLGVACAPVIEHLKSLGVTAIELLPIHHMVSERPLVERGLSNYWGYNSVAFFAPDSRFATGANKATGATGANKATGATGANEATGGTGTAGPQVVEFKAMVKALHRAGIEVILDVVYNHTAEGNQSGPTLSLRGFGNLAYYRLQENKRFHEDFTGCGNTLDTRHPRGLQLVVDSLRYWVSEMHVDGFRFDLAPALAREPSEFNRDSKFFTVVAQDPVLSQVKLIAEPWDLGPSGYQVGAFPASWTEWNGRYRDALRSFWRGDRGKVSELASRLSGNSDIYYWGAGVPPASINFITAHDGYTLADLSSYEKKHNEANGEDNRDGNDHNLSRNWGAEGPSDDPEIVAIRQRMMRNFLASLAFSQGVPMIVAGDELGRSQKGNNNAYCQDNELTWIDWSLVDDNLDLLDFARRVFALRRENPVLRRRSFFTGSTTQSGVKDLTWLRPDGNEMGPQDWADDKRQTLGMLIAGEATDEVDEHGRRVAGSTLLMLVNAGPQSRSFRLPQMAVAGIWRCDIDTARPGERLVKTLSVSLLAGSLMLLSYVRQGI
jgi:glycogen operon protein